MQYRDKILNYQMHKKNRRVLKSIQENAEQACQSYTDMPMSQEEAYRRLHKSAHEPEVLEITEESIAFGAICGYLDPKQIQRLGDRPNPCKARGKICESCKATTLRVMAYLSGKKPGDP